MTRTEREHVFKFLDLALTRLSSSLPFSQREEAVLVRAGPRCHGGRRSLLHSEGQVEPPSRAGAEPPGGVQKDRRDCRQPSGAQTAPTAVPPHVSHFALLWVSVGFAFLPQSKFPLMSILRQPGALSFPGRLINQLRGSSRGGNSKRSVSGSAWRASTSWTSRRK